MACLNYIVNNERKFFINARIIDPSQNIDEVGGL